MTINPVPNTRRQRLALKVAALEAELDNTSWWKFLRRKRLKLEIKQNKLYRDSIKDPIA